MCSFPYGPSVLTPGCLELGRQRCHQSPEEQGVQAAGSVSAKEGKELGGDHRPARDLGYKLVLKLTKDSSRRRGLKMVTLRFGVSHPCSFRTL